MSDALSHCPAPLGVQHTWVAAVGGQMELAYLLGELLGSCRAPETALAVMAPCVQRPSCFKTGVFNMCCQVGPVPESPGSQKHFSSPQG